MAAGYDDFLSELRTQLAQCARAASQESASPIRRAEHRPWQVRPRIAIAFAAGLLVPAVVAGVLLVSSFTTSGLEPSPRSNELLNGSESGDSPAYVQPLVPGLSPSPGAPSGAAAQVSYSLWAVAARSTTEAWAVGSRTVSDGRGPTHAGSFILKWNGVTWSETIAPDIGPLSAVAAAPNGEAWALNGAAGAILHYSDGQWTAVASGAPSGCTLNGLTVAAANDVWAVGGQASGPLVLHWNGLTWSTADLRALSAAGGSLAAVSSSSSANVWAVGTDAAGQTLVLHHDGSGWTPLTGTDPSASGFSGLRTVAAVSPTDVWLAGDRLLHYDGIQWSDVSSTPGRLSGPMSAASASDIWARGDDLRSVIHWDGETWRAIDAAEMGLPADQDVSLQAVTALPGGGVWAVGTIRDSGESTQRPLVVRLDGSGWHVAVDTSRVYGEE